MRPRTPSQWVKVLASAGHGRPARRGDPQLPAVRAPAGGDDVGTADAAAGPARPTAPRMRPAGPRPGARGSRAAAAQARLLWRAGPDRQRPMITVDCRA